MAASAALHGDLFVARLSRVLFSVAVEGLARCACTLCFPFSGARQRPLVSSWKRGGFAAPFAFARGIWYLMRVFGL